MPPKPNELTAARRGVPSARRAQGRVRLFTYSGESPKPCGFGAVTLMVGGSTFSCNARASLIRPAAPAAALVCPICDLMLPIAADDVPAPEDCRKPESAESSVRSPTAVPVPCASKSPTLSGLTSASS